MSEHLAEVLADYADTRVPYVADNPEAPVPFALTSQAEAELDTWTGPAPDPAEIAVARDAWARPAMDAEPDLDREAAEMLAEHEPDPEPGWWYIPDPDHSEAGLDREAIAAERAAYEAELLAEAEAEANAPEWDDAESSAYVDRAEAGLEPEA